MQCDVSREEVAAAFPVAGVEFNQPTPRTIGARMQIGYGTTGERAIRETQIIRRGGREVSVQKRRADGYGVEMALIRVLRGNPS